MERVFESMKKFSRKLPIEAMDGVALILKEPMEEAGKVPYH